VEDAARVQERWGVIRQEPDAIRYADAVRQLPFVEQLLRGELALEWAAARVIRDDPAKVLQPRERVDLHMISRLQQALGSPERELDLVSPYFVPGKDGSAGLRELVERGVTVRVLTNSLGATDVGPVHAGYTRYRSELLRGGVRLYELKPTIQPPRPEQDPGPSAFGSSSGASLHAKSFAVDRRRVFVGSFNLDPRSARLNTEMGVVIDSPALASRLSAAFDTAFPLHAYEVRLASDGRTLEWIDRTGGEEKRLTTEPGTGLMRRWWIGFLAMLPIEWML
jgi:putative cardiolipin synthase